MDGGACFILIDEGVERRHGRVVNDVPTLAFSKGHASMEAEA